MSLYRLFVPSQAVGASVVYFDLFVPSTSGKRVEVMSCQPLVSGATAVTGSVGIDVFLTRTTAVGTGGTAATFEGTSLSACTISCHDGSQPLTSVDISARLTPSGGATAGAALSWRSLFGEETNSAAYAPVPDLARNLYPDMPGVIIPAGTGIRVVQGTVASAGNVGFDVIFRAVPTP